MTKHTARDLTHCNVAFFNASLLSVDARHWREEGNARRYRASDAQEDLAIMLYTCTLYFVTIIQFRWRRTKSAIRSTDCDRCS